MALMALMIEFELVKQALYIDPNDQSGWLYHRWLVGRGDDPAVLEREIVVITEILELEADSKCTFSLTLSIFVFLSIRIEFYYIQGASNRWCTTDDYSYAIGQSVGTGWSQSVKVCWNA